MLKKTLVSLAVSGLLQASALQALELGELTPKSGLNEPFRAEIQLQDTEGLSNRDIRIRLGSESQFRQAGFLPATILSQLKFSVKKRSDGGFYIEATTESAVPSNELRFVLSALWPSGQITREYRVPLNTPSMVESSGSEVVESVSKAAPAMKPMESPFSSAVSQARRMAPDKTVAVKQGNTLWSIAGGNDPKGRLTVYQTMMAIQALNEDAFQAHNINLLKEGAVLRLPTNEQIALFNKALSKQEFEKQHQAWLDMKRGGKLPTEVTQAQMNTQAESKPAASMPPPEDDQLAIVSGASMLPQEAAGSNDEDSEAVAELETKLSATQELLDKEQREKSELNDRLEDVNGQLETLEQLISLKDAQLAELQQQLMSAQQTLQEQKNTVDQLLEADQLRREKEQAEANSLANKIMSNPIFMSIGAVVLLLLGFLIGFLVRKLGRKKPAKGNTEFDLADAAVPAVAAAAVTAAVAEEKEEPEVQEDLPEEDPFAFDFDTGSETDFDEFDDLNVQVSDSEPETDDDLDGFGEDFDFGDSDDAVEEDDLASLESEMDELSEIDEEALPEDPLEGLDLEEESDLEMVPDEETDEIPTIEPDDEFTMEDEPSDEEFNSDSTDEEESFVNNLLNDEDLEDNQDESDLFDQDPNETLASSIEETLAEAQNELEAEEDLEIPEFTPDEVEEPDSDESGDDDEEEIDFFDASGDEVATKLDLARAYMDMGDDEGARVILDDVMDTGNEKQIAEAQNMLERMAPGE